MKGLFVISTFIFLAEFIIILAPWVLALLFPISLVLFCYTKIKNRRFPGTYTKEQVKKRLIFLIVSAMILIVEVIGAIILTALAYMAIAYM